MSIPREELTDMKAAFDLYSTEDEGQTEGIHVYVVTVPDGHEVIVSVHRTREGLTEGDPNMPTQLIDDAEANPGMCVVGPFGDYQVSYVEVGR